MPLPDRWNVNYDVNDTVGSNSDTWRPVSIIPMTENPTHFTVDAFRTPPSHRRPPPVLCRNTSVFGDALNIGREFIFVAYLLCTGRRTCIARIVADI
ncbi:hypothetical protein GWI33_005708 [Rhynchophorus ferrugineus]|uniref:Uncharacterized protein n=1 Tax=Rhynchophorus ferrugineus TaxID=354439 RepID=A0A834IH12_RHYFE|nr:hypothetical protein GWI33_005708 [Rhynchophorus ferrugineus]